MVGLLNSSEVYVQDGVDYCAVTVDGGNNLIEDGFGLEKFISLTAVVERSESQIL